MHNAAQLHREEPKGDWSARIDQETLIYIVDDDETVRDALLLLLRIEGYQPRCFGDAESFLQAVRETPPVCVILDLNLPGCTPLAVLQQLAAWRFKSPVLVISGQSDIAVAVAAMKEGAFDFFEKPFASGTILSRVREAIAHWRQMHNPVSGLANFAGRARLTRRECDVLAEVARGASNKEAGRRLHISPRTVEVHRARIMGKLGARNTADLMRIVLSSPAEMVSSLGSIS
ncbi:MAG TPA: response regulator [Xanthobacteraceae bacterium]|nr:response regulator [Xanthobacteraceae bacterium]